MSIFAIEFDVGSAFANVFGYRLFKFECLPELIEVANFEIGAVLDRAGLRLDVSQQQTQERRLADTIVANQTDAVAAHYLDRKILDQRFVVAIVHMSRTDHLAAGTLRLLDMDARLRFA